MSVAHCGLAAALSTSLISLKRHCRFTTRAGLQAEFLSRLAIPIDRAGAYILGTPDYHGSISSALKNFLDHFWQEFAGKLFASVVASHEKGLTVTDQADSRAPVLRVVAPLRCCVHRC